MAYIPEVPKPNYYEFTLWAKENKYDIGKIKDNKLNSKQEKYFMEYSIEKVGKFIKKVESAQKAAATSKLRFNSIDSLVNEAL